MEGEGERDGPSVCVCVYALVLYTVGKLELLVLFILFVGGGGV